MNLIRRSCVSVIMWELDPRECIYWKKIHRLNEEDLPRLGNKSLLLPFTRNLLRFLNTYFAEELSI